MDGTLQGSLARAKEQESFRVKAGNVLFYYTNRNETPRVLLASASPRESRLTQLREAAFAAVRAAQRHRLQSLVIAFDPKNEEEVEAISEGALFATYSYEHFRSEKIHRALDSITVLSSKKAERAGERARISCEAAAMVRDLVNEPPNLLSSEKLAETAKRIAQQDGLQIRIFQKSELERMGANAFLSVGKGSELPGRMVHVHYRPKRKPSAHVAIVGKGIMFDSGGLSLKNEQQMLHMKSDMAGAATSLACVHGAARMRLPVEVSALMMLTENMPDAGANRPGDVVRAMKGKTIEITNTDAEGRLALADGLAYAETLKPDYLIDIATLTGAQIIGLGRLVGAVMGNNDKLIRKIVQAGQKSGETMWPLPLPEKYRDLIKSDAADVKNSSGIPEAGSIQAGLFLSEFVSHPAWVHLDIAGPSWQEREWSIYTKNASGFGTRCLLTFLSNL